MDNKQELTQDEQDERACGERVQYWLNKYGCVLKGQCIIEDGGMTAIRVGIVKIPAEIRKQMKEAEKNGQRPKES